jgi:hypothetical protein
MIIIRNAISFALHHAAQGDQRAEILRAAAVRSEIDIEVLLDPDQQRGVRQRIPAIDIVGGSRHVDSCCLNAEGLGNDRKYSRANIVLVHISVCRPARYFTMFSVRLIFPDVDFISHPGATIEIVFGTRPSKSRS